MYVTQPRKKKFCGLDLDWIGGWVEISGRFSIQLRNVLCEQRAMYEMK